MYYGQSFNEESIGLTYHGWQGSRMLLNIRGLGTAAPNLTDVVMSGLNPGNSTHGTTMFVPVDTETNTRIMR